MSAELTLTSTASSHTSDLTEVGQSSPITVPSPSIPYPPSPPAGLSLSPSPPEQGSIPRHQLLPRAPYPRVTAEITPLHDGAVGADLGASRQFLQFAFAERGGVVCAGRRSVRGGRRRAVRSLLLLLLLPLQTLLVGVSLPAAYRYGRGQTPENSRATPEPGTSSQKVLVVTQSKII